MQTLVSTTMRAQSFSRRITSELLVILPRSKASSKLRFRSRQVIEKMVTLASSKVEPDCPVAGQLDAVRSAA